MKVLIIDNYDSFTFNLYQMLQPLVDERVEVYRNDCIDFNSILANQPDKIILSPGPGHPRNAFDFGVGKDIILRQKELGSSILGVCLGHQGIVHYLGGQIVQAPQIIHGKTSLINVQSASRLLDGLPSSFYAMRYHSLIASDEGFPTELTVTARENDAALIMALEHKHAPIYGVQFHPESIGTPEGNKILRNFIELC